MRAEHARGPLIQYWGEWGWIPVLGGRDRGVGEEINGVGRVSTRGCRYASATYIMQTMEMPKIFLTFN